VYQKGDVVGGKYVLERFLGAGAFASVWAAKNKTLDRRVALKILVETLSRKPDVVRRFVREAKLASKLTHPTIVRVEDVEQSEKGEIYIVMELLEGETLSARLKARGALSVPECLSIAEHLLQGLASAHEVGIVHRDIKPANVFLPRPGSSGPPVRLLDFGVAKDLGDDERLTATGHLVGTPMFLAPEILLCDGDDNWQPGVDVYAMGLVLFKMLTGRLPLDEDEKRPAHARIADIVLFFKSGRPLPGPAECSPLVPAPIDDVVRRAISVAPGDRYRDAGEMLAALTSAAIFFEPTKVKLRVLPEPALDEPAPDETAEAPAEDPVPLLEDVTLQSLDESREEVAAPTGDGAEADSHTSGTPFQWDVADAPTAAGPRRVRPGVALAAIVLVGIVALASVAASLVFGGASRTTTDPAESTSSSRAAAQRTAELISSMPAARPDAGAATQAPPAPPAIPLALAELRGLPDGAVVTFDGVAVADGRVEATAGARGQLVVRARGYLPFHELVTIRDGQVIDLSGRLVAAATGGATQRGSRPRGEKAPNHISGTRPGSKIKVLSGSR
jgi:serine/threonine-protein kinase